MLPEQLRSVRRLMFTTVNDMRGTFNYYYTATSPLRGHKTFNDGLAQTYSMNSNMTNLSNLINSSAQDIDMYEKMVVSQVDKMPVDNNNMTETDKTK